MQNNFQEISSQNIFKTWMIIGFFSLIIVSVGWALGKQFNNSMFLYGSILFSLVSVWSSYFNSDKVAIESSGSVPIDENTQTGRRLDNIVTELAREAGIPKPKIFIMNDNAINAFATGRNPENASVSVTLGAMEKLNDTELSGVLAHELTHVKNRDILVMTIVITLANIFMGLANFLSGLNTGSNEEVEDREQEENSGKSLFSTILVLAVSFLAPIAASLIQAAVSRKREYMADAGGAIITHNPEGLASALEKIKLYSQPMVKKSLSTSHLFISSPYRLDLSGIKVGFLENLFATHPPLDERIAILRGQKK